MFKPSREARRSKPPKPVNSKQVEDKFKEFMQFKTIDRESLKVVKKVDSTTHDDLKPTT